MTGLWELDDPGHWALGTAFLNLKTPARATGPGRGVRLPGGGPPDSGIYEIVSTRSAAIGRGKARYPTQRYITHNQ